MSPPQILLDFTWLDHKGKVEVFNRDVLNAHLEPGTPGHDLLLNMGAFEGLSYAERRGLIFSIAEVRTNPRRIATLISEKGDCFNPEVLERIIQRLQNEEPSPIRQLIDKAASHLPSALTRQFDRRGMLAWTAKAAAGGVAGAAVGNKLVRPAVDKITGAFEKKPSRPNSVIVDALEKPNASRSSHLLSREAVLNALPEITTGLAGAWFSAHDFDKNRDIRRIANMIDMCVLETAKEKGLLPQHGAAQIHSGQNPLPTHGR